MERDLVVVLVEDDEDDARSYKEAIENFLDVTVKIVHPIPRSVQELAAQVGEMSPSAIIFDERLPIRSDAEYDGIDAIEHFRNVGLDVPIVVLTNFPDDQELKDREFLTDMIWEKRKFDEEEKTYLSRLGRRIGELQARKKDDERIQQILDIRIREELVKSKDVSPNLVNLIAAQHFFLEPSLRLIVWIRSETNEEIRLVEINALTTPTGSTDVFSIPPSESIPIPIKIADVTPSEWSSIRSGGIELPTGWSLEGSGEFERTILEDILN